MREDYIDDYVSRITTSDYIKQLPYLNAQAARIFQVVSWVAENIIVRKEMIWQWHNFMGKQMTRNQECQGIQTGKNR